MEIDKEKELLAAQLKGSLLYFTRFFFQHITGREFVISNPVGRESHHITICRELTKIFYLEVPSQRLNINIQPGSHKSTLLSMFVAWCWAHYPDCNFLYISYAHELAAKQTSFIKQIVQSRMYGHLFDVHLKKDSRAKDHFETMAGGAVKAFGSAGGITGQNAGLPSLERFSGAVLLDDCLKPKDAHSDTIRTGVIENYRETIVPRPRGMNVPILSIAQRVHEDDLCAFFTSGKDIREWDSIILKAIDDAGNVLHPEVTSEEYLLSLQDKSPYLFSSQYQQNPIPAGGALFKPEGFVILAEEPGILRTFITADTAETAKSYNDASVFSFWGVYEIETMGRKTGEIGLHWLDCVELRIEPKYLKDAFLDFWQECMRHPIAPSIAAIEKKSTGVTLTSVLDDIRTITIRGIERSRASGSKTDRFIQLQPIVASKLISFTEGAAHVKMCIDHMLKITANNTHKNDDICFVAGTKIATKFGYKNIEDVKEGEKVITPFGYGLVTCATSTGTRATITRKGLCGTKNHPVFSGNKFSSLDTLTDDDIISSFSFRELAGWKYKRLLCLMESPIASWGRDVIISVSQRATKAEKGLKGFMSRSGSFIAGKQFLKAMLFIIKTMIILITVMRILSVFHAANILKTIQKIGRRGLVVKRTRSILKKLMPWPSFGIRATKERSGIGLTSEQVLISSGRLNVRFAELSSKLEAQTPPIAKKNAKTSNMQEKPEKNEQEKEVFNLTIETYGVYYANGVLVSNCDTLYDACKIALIDKTIYSIKKQDTSRADKFSSLSQSYKRKLAAGAARNG